METERCAGCPEHSLANEKAWRVVEREPWVHVLQEDALIVKLMCTSTWVKGPVSSNLWMATKTCLQQCRASAVLPTNVQYRVVAAEAAQIIRAGVIAGGTPISHKLALRQEERHQEAAQWRSEEDELTSVDHRSKSLKICLEHLERACTQHDKSPTCRRHRPN
jgi:hypothetical protein